MTTLSYTWIDICDSRDSRYSRYSRDSRDSWQVGANENHSTAGARQTHTRINTHTDRRRGEQHIDNQPASMPLSRLSGWLVRSFFRCLVRSFACSFTGSFFRWFFRGFARLFVRSIACLFVRSFACYPLSGTRTANNSLGEFELRTQHDGVGTRNVFRRDSCSLQRA